MKANIIIFKFENLRIAQGCRRHPAFTTQLAHRDDGHLCNLVWCKGLQSPFSVLEPFAFVSKAKHFWDVDFGVLKTTKLE